MHFVENWICNRSNINNFVYCKLLLHKQLILERQWLLHNVESITTIIGRFEETIATDWKFEQRMTTAHVRGFEFSSLFALKFNEPYPCKATCDIHCKSPLVSTQLMTKQIEPLKIMSKPFSCLLNFPLSTIGDKFIPVSMCAYISEKILPMFCS